MQRKKKEPRHDETPADAEEARTEAPCQKGREGLQVMPAPDYSWIADPDVITSAIQLLAGAVAGTGALLVAVLAWIWNKTDAKIDRIANSLETLTLTTSIDLATIKATCKANHPD